MHGVSPVSNPIVVPFKAIWVFLSGESDEYHIFRDSLLCATITSLSGIHLKNEQNPNKVYFSLVVMLNKWRLLFWSLNNILFAL